MHLDGERALWAGDDGRWDWDGSEPAEPAEPTEPAGLDAGLGLDRMWSPPDAQPARRLRRVADRVRGTSRRTRLLVAGVAAVTASGTALGLLLADGGNEQVAASPTPAHAYTSEAQENYLRQCRDAPGGSETLCGCSLAQFQARYSQEEFVALQARFAAQDPTALQQFTAIAAACIPH